MEIGSKGNVVFRSFVNSEFHRFGRRDELGKNRIMPPGRVSVLFCLEVYCCVVF